MFEQLDEYGKSDPKKYMEIVKNIRDGNFDKNKNQDSDSISPTGWRDHFSDLLGTNPQKIDQDISDHYLIVQEKLINIEIIRVELRKIYQIK